MGVGVASSHVSAVSADIDSEITHIRFKDCSFTEDTERAPKAYYALLKEGPFKVLGNVKRRAFGRIINQRLEV